MTQRAYCVREGIKWPTFDYWRRQILSETGMPTPAKKPTTTGGLTLVPVHVTGKQSHDVLSLRSPAGWELRLPTAVDPDWLMTVLRQLP